MIYLNYTKKLNFIKSYIEMRLLKLNLYIYFIIRFLFFEK